MQIELESQAQSVLYGGEPIDGVEVDCLDDMAFDSLRNRILYHNQAANMSCSGEGYFAVDVESGVTEQLFTP